jgi:hypothetical protein
MLIAKETLKGATCMDEYGCVYIVVRTRIIFSVEVNPFLFCFSPSSNLAPYRES